MMDAITAYEAEFKRWKVVKYNGLSNDSRSHLYYVVRSTHAKSGLLSHDQAKHLCQVLAKRGAEAAAAKVEETMQISLPDWYQGFYGEEQVAA